MKKTLSAIIIILIISAEGMIFSIEAVVDNTPPTGSISINNNTPYTTSSTVTLTLSCSDDISGCSQMQFSNDGANFSSSEGYTSSKSWQLSVFGEGTKTVYVKFKDNAGNWSGAFSDSITLDTKVCPKPPPYLGIFVDIQAITVNLRWSSLFMYDSKCVDGFNIYRKLIDTNNNSYEKIGSSIRESIGYSDSSVTVGNTYRYAIKSYNNVNGAEIESNFSNEVQTQLIDNNPAIREADANGDGYDDKIYLSGYSIKIEYGPNYDSLNLYNIDNLIGLSLSYVIDINNSGGIEIIGLYTKAYTLQKGIYVIDDSIKEINFYDIPDSHSALSLYYIGDTDGAEGLEIVGIYRENITIKGIYIIHHATDKSIVRYSFNSYNSFEILGFEDIDGCDGLEIKVYAWDNGSNRSANFIIVDRTQQRYYEGESIPTCQPPPPQDTTPPSGTISINGGVAYTNSPSVTLSLTCSDNLTGCSEMQFSNDGANFSSPEGIASSKSWQLSAGDGTKTVYVKFKDGAGNWSGAFSDTIILDTTPPSGTISINRGDAYTNSPSVTLSLSCSDNLTGCSKMQFSNDGTNFSSPEGIASSKSWQLSGGDGTKTVYVKFKDGAGNWSGAFSDTIILDTTPPETSITSKPTGCIVETITNSPDANFTFTGSDNITSPENLLFSYRIDNGAWSAWSSSKTAVYTNLPDGDHTFEVRAQDQAANIDPTPAVYVWTIDTVPPNPPVIESASNGNRIHTADFDTYIFTHWDIKGTTDSDTYTLWVNGSQDKVNHIKNNTNWSYSADNLTIGAVNTYSVTARDIACNESSPGVINITIPDGDEDGIGDLWESLYGLDPNNPSDALLDPDRDGLINRDEYLYMDINGNTLNPRLWDTDKDGMPDGWEVENRLDPLSDDANGDPDRDGLINRDEYINNTDPHNPDTDGDGMDDKWEVDNKLRPNDPTDAAEDKDGDLYTNLEEYLDGSDPTNPNSFFGRMVSSNNEIWSDIFSEGGGDTGSSSYNMVSVTGGGIGGVSVSRNNVISSGFFFHETVLDQDNPDLDNDGMSDYWEIVYGVGDPNADPDNDNLTNLEEYQNNTNPNNTDTDGDGMPDGWEVLYGLNPTDPNDAGIDRDGDGYSNLDEYLAGRNPIDSFDLPARMTSSNYNMTVDVMSEGGGEEVSASYAITGVIGQTVTGISSSPDNLISSGFFIQQSVIDPNGPDRDFDGMPDTWEIRYGLDPDDSTDASEDRDNDGLTSLEEYQNDTNPTNPDTDGDGMLDGWEVDNGLNPKSPSDADIDSDGDGFTNLEEYLAGRDPNNPQSNPGMMHSGQYTITNRAMSETGEEIRSLVSGDSITGLMGIGITGISVDGNNIISAGFFVNDNPFDAQDLDMDGMLDAWERRYGVDDPLADPDTDGLANIEEYTNGTDPTNPDTDLDGMPDGWEVQYGLNPTDNSDALIDSDSDGYSNYDEYLAGRNPNDPQESPGILNSESYNITNSGISEGGGEIGSGLYNMVSFIGQPATGISTRSGKIISAGYFVRDSVSPIADPDLSIVKVKPTGIIADGVSIFTITVIPKYGNGTDMGTGQIVSISTTEGILLGDMIDTGTGSYTQAIQASSTESTAVITAAVNNVYLAERPQVEFLSPSGDYDNDGLTNSDEIKIYMTDPLDNDTDKDSMPDGWEVQYRLNPLTDDSQADADRDGITNLQEYIDGTDPTNQYSRLGQNISGTGMATQPQIDVDNNGNPHIVWEDMDGNNYEIYYSGYDGTQWSDIINISNTLGYSFNPAIAADDTDNIHIVWEDATSGNYEIYYRVYDGTKWSVIDNISNTSGYSFAPDIAIDDMGNIHVVWEELIAGNYEIYYSMYNGISWSQGTNISETAGHSSTPAIAVDVNRNIHIVWTEEVSGSYEIYYRRYDGILWLTPENISENQGASLNPDIVVDSTGNPRVVWEDMQQGNYEIYYSQYNNGWLPAINISNTQGYSGSARIDIDSSGSLHTVWMDDTTDRWEIYYTEYDGLSWNLPQNISNTNSDSFFSAIARDKNSNVHIVWEEHDGTNTDILYNIYNKGINKPVDIVPPESVIDLYIGVITADTVQLTWTATGDDWAIGTASSYDIRYSESPITNANWGSAAQVTGEPIPQAAGNPELFTVTGMACAKTYYFGLKSKDEVLNESGLSNITSAITSACPIPDNTSPSPVTNLTTGIITSASVQLAWTAPGDDGNIGRASSYDIRHSELPITEANWGSAAQATGEPIPQAAGNPELFTVTGMACGTTHYFGIKASDEVPNESGLSNIISAIPLCPDNIVLIRKKLNGAQSLQIYKPPAAVRGDIGAPVVSDNSIGKNVILMTVGEFDGDAGREIAIVRQDPLRGIQRLLIHNLPTTVGGDIGIPIASDKRIGDADKGSRVILMAGGDFDGDSIDEIAIAREDLNGKQRLFIYNVPTMTDGDIGIPIASDKMIGNSGKNSNLVLMTAGDYDLDGSPELAFVRQRIDGKQRLMIYETPAIVGGDIGSPIASDLSVGNAAKNTNIIQIAGGDFDGNGMDEIAIVRERLSGKQKLFIHKVPAMVDGDIGAPIASDNRIGSSGKNSNVVMISGVKR